MSVAFDVPVAYFLVPPPRATCPGRLADTGRPTGDLYGALLGRADQLLDLDQRLRQVDIASPEATPGPLRAMFGLTRGALTWSEHYPVWRQECLRQLAADHGAALRSMARFMSELADELSETAREAALADLAVQARRRSRQGGSNAFRRGDSARDADHAGYHDLFAGIDCGHPGNDLKARLLVVRD